MKTDEEIKKEERIWIFIAYEEDGLPFFSKLFTDHTEMKEFSANHSGEWKDKCKKYSSTYLDLTDKSLFHTLKEEYEEKLRIMKAACEGAGDQNLMAYKAELIEKIEKLKYPDGSCGNADLELANNQAIREAINIIKQ